MITVISPAKTLDFESEGITPAQTLPDFLDESSELVNTLKTFSADKISSLMKISDKLGALNSSRFQQWNLPFTKENSKPAIHAFKGDVYIGLEAETLSQPDLQFAQNHLRILSGLYGLLRPLDLIQAYRLEMGTSLKNKKGTNLYAFWDAKLTHQLNEELEKQKDRVLINLASNEYFKAVKQNLVNGKIITPVFKESRNGAFKVISFNAKKARGLMSRFIVQNRIETPEALKRFTKDDYRYNPSLSTETEWVFTR